MAADGSHGPAPWTQHQARTVFIRAPSADWIGVKRGTKSQFRTVEGLSSVTWAVEPPLPVVCYRAHRTLGYDAALMVLEATWQEPLGAISVDSLKREGFDTLADFRAYWIARTRRRFPPLKMVRVYRVRPWAAHDEGPMGSHLLRTLYGEWL